MQNQPTAPLAELPPPYACPGPTAMDHFRATGVYFQHAWNRLPTVTSRQVVDGLDFGFKGIVILPCAAAASIYIGFLCFFLNLCHTEIIGKKVQHDYAVSTRVLSLLSFYGVFCALYCTGVTDELAESLEELGLSAQGDVEETFRSVNFAATFSFIASIIVTCGYVALQERAGRAGHCL